MVERAIQALSQGKFVIVVDDEDRENEGDLVIAAEYATKEAVAFMVRHTTGILCVPLPKERLNELKLPQMVLTNTESQRTAFTISVDLKEGTTTGVSAHDRSLTIRALADPSYQADDFLRPGHIFPLEYREGGVLKRAGHTEASIDLVSLAGLQKAAVIAELISPDGSMARKEALQVFSTEHDIPLISIQDLIRYRRQKEHIVERISSARLPTPFGEFSAFVYRSLLDGIEHIALVKGEVDQQQSVMVRVHSECLTGDSFLSLRCDCGEQLRCAMEQIAKEGRGVIVYLRGHEGRGIGLAHKLRAYGLQDLGQDTVEANLSLGLPIDSREYGVGAHILSDLGITTLRLLTNNPAKYGGLAGYNLTITERIPLAIAPREENRKYLETKRDKLGHTL